MKGKHVRIAAGIFTVLAVALCVSAVYADYAFDDLFGPGGISYQWMIISNSGETFGDTHSSTLDVSGDLLTTGEAVLNVTSGKSASEVQDRSLNTMFLVLADDHGEFTMNFRAPSLSRQFDVATPNLSLSGVTDNMSCYTDTKTPQGWPGGNYDQLWRGYNFQIDRYRASGNYDTVMQYFYFQQNPYGSSSQGMPVPFVISNVYYGTAADVPLKLRLTLRDSTNMEGNITAHNRISWHVDDNINACDDNDTWVFVPVDDLNTDNVRIEYLLTAEVANHSAVRYAAYDGASDTGGVIYPSDWKFDIARTQGMNGIPGQFQLAPSSHIAPGLVSVYRRPLNINSGSLRPLRLFAVDDAMGTGLYDLRLNLRTIFGRRLGSTYKYAASEGRFNLFEVTAFQPRTSSMNFYNDLARITGSTGSVSVPENVALSSGTVKHDYMPGEALQCFTIDQSIPANLRTSENEGMLPLHITFNIPVSMIQNRSVLNELINGSLDGESLAELFANYYRIYLQASSNGRTNTLDMTEQLQRLGLYSSLVKVFYDDERGRITSDNDRGLITVSFIVMLMNGTRDGVRPMMAVVPDESSEQTNNYIVIRDGNTNDKWDMTFLIAPAGYNPDPVDELEITKESLSSGTANACYSDTLTAELSGSAVSPVWTVDSGTLPPGLTLDALTGALTGTPEYSGTYAFTVTAEYSTGSQTYTASKRCVMTVTPASGSLQTAPEFNMGHALVLDGQIGVIFYVKLPEEPGTNYNASNCWMEFDIRGDRSNNPRLLDTTSRMNFTDSDGIRNYAFVCYINSAQMADPITATLHYGDNQILTQQSSADAYLTGMMGKFTGVVKDLMIAIKDYGHYVQPMLSNANGWKIGELFLEMEGASVYTEQDIEEVRQAAAQYAVVRDTKDSKISSVGFALRLGSTTSVLLYLNTEAGYTGEVSAYLEGSSENIAVKQSSGQYLVEIADIPAHELHEVSTITVNAGTSFEVKVCALSYVDTMLNKEGIGQDIREAVTALYKYRDAAMKYRAAAN